MEKKISLIQFKDDLYDGISNECIFYILENSSLQIAKKEKNNFIILESTPSYKGEHVEIKLNYASDNNLFYIDYVEIDNFVIDNGLQIADDLVYLENFINNMYNSIEETPKKKLPTKSDFRLNDDYILDIIGEEYIKEHEKWMNNKIKEHYIDVSADIDFSLLTDNQKKSIENMFTSLGFDKSDIEIKEFIDTHNLWIMLKIY